MEPDIKHTLGGRGLFSLATLIALMLFVAESSNGAFASHSSTLIVSLAGVGTGSSVWFRRGGARVEVIFKISETRFGRQPANTDNGSTRLHLAGRVANSIRVCIVASSTERPNAGIRNRIGTDLSDERLAGGGDEGTPVRR